MSWAAINLSTQLKVSKPLPRTHTFFRLASNEYIVDLSLSVAFVEVRGERQSSPGFDRLSTFGGSELTSRNLTDHCDATSDPGFCDGELTA